jgi:hypothetical protein
MAKAGGEAVDNQIHRLLSIMSGVALCVISGSLFAQESPKPASPGITPAVVAGPRVGGVQRIAYSAEEVIETTQTLADGTHITQKRWAKIYQDSQGRSRRESFGPQMGTEGQDDTPMMVSIFDPVAGVSYNLNPRNHTAHKNDMHPPTPPPPRQMTDAPATPRPALADRPRPTQEALGTQVLEGIEVRGTRTTFTIPAGAQGNDQPIEVTSENWYSPELHLVMMNTSHEPRRGETVRRLTNLVRDEPPAELFQVPPDYSIEETQTIVKPPSGPE